jgi:hypothetical protein
MIKYSIAIVLTWVYPFDQEEPSQTFILLVSVSKITIPKYGFAGRFVDVQIPGRTPLSGAEILITMTAQ